MTPEQKHYALDLVSSWTTARNQAAGTYVADKLAALLQELVDAPEPETVARDAGLYLALSNLVDEGEAYVVFMGKVDTIHTGLEVNNSADLRDELGEAIRARGEKGQS